LFFASSSTTRRAVICGFQMQNEKEDVLQSSVEVARNVYQRECFRLSSRTRPASAKTEAEQDLGPMAEAQLSPTQPVLISDLVAEAPTKPLPRPQTAHKHPRAVRQAASTIPRKIIASKLVGEDEYSRLKQRLFDKIIAERRYQNSRLDDLYQQVLQENSHLNPDSLAAMWNELMLSLTS
jgi:hypothetical protein